MMKLLINLLWVTLMLSLANSEDVIFSEDIGTKIPTPEQQAIEGISSSINEFGFRLINELMKRNENENIVISPAGISGLLAMALLGSVGDSYEELARVLGFSEDVRINRENHEHFGELLRTLYMNDTSSKTMYADVIFADKSSKLREAYRLYLNRVYGGDAITTDFRNQEAAKDIINEWVKDNTNGKIPNFLKQTLPIDTKVVLMSALYFIGQWKNPFIIEYTKKLPFKGPTENVMVEQMLNMGSFPFVSSYTEGIDLHMIGLPYNDSVNTMYALKPRRPNDSLSELLNKLNFKKINDLIAKMKNRKCVIRYPKMDLQKTLNLEETLKAVGVSSIFKPGQANFALMIDSNTVMNRTENELISRINTGDFEESQSLKKIVDSLPNPGVYVDTVLHDVKLTIDEYGTEAVAATSGILARTAVQFYADTPFFMFIRNDRTGLITFSAVIFNPKSLQV